MTRATDDFRNSHLLIGVLDWDSTLEVTFFDGDVFRVSQCSPIDPSVYGLNGGWCCMSQEYLGSCEKRRRLFPQIAGIDIYEEDILRIKDCRDDSILYEWEPTEQADAAKPPSRGGAAANRRRWAVGWFGNLFAAIGALTGLR